ncbi:MAG: 3-deoxy-manno-octulosonate cytidylyltransferase, partial [Chitinophagales bacterium]
MKIIGIIPARMASTRFPNKPLVDILGKTMIQRTYEQAIQNEQLDEVIVATDHQAIFDEVTSFGGKVVMTDINHKNGTERIAEVAKKYTEDTIIINIQGDEPFFEPSSLDALIACFDTKNVQIATLIKQIEDIKDLESNTIIKVVKTLNNKSL